MSAQKTTKAIQKAGDILNHANLSFVIMAVDGEQNGGVSSNLQRASVIRMLETALNNVQARDAPMRLVNGQFERTQ
jgi:hypothetical protein